MGLHASAQCIVNDVRIQPAHFEPAIPKEVGGWLLAFCIILAIFFPAQSLYQIFSHTIPSLASSHSPKLTLLLSVYCVLFGALAALSAIAGVALWLVKSGAVLLARRFLWTFLISHFAYFCFFVLLTRPRQALSFAEMGWYHIVGPIGFFWFWYVYLDHSKRVRETYGENSHFA
jgi:hypothetical protein